MPVEKAISFVVPCYNSADYMDRCIQSLIDLNSKDDDIEVIVIDDGSQEDGTLEKALDWQRRHPTTIRAIHQENKGHGGAVNTGLENARGLYFKVVDSDDWLDGRGTAPIMGYLRKQVQRVRDGGKATDMVVGNYVYTKLTKKKGSRAPKTKLVPIKYTDALPVGKEFTWDDIQRFKMGKYLSMHSLIYRTQLLRDADIRLLENTFYVDSILACCPLPFVRSAYYLNTNMYRYVIGREGQSVNEDIIQGRVDQVLYVAKAVIQSLDFEKLKTMPKLEKYIFHYLAQIMSVCTIILRMIDTEEADAKRKDIWKFLKKHNRRAHDSAFRSPMCCCTSVPTKYGRAFCLWGYRMAKRLIPFT